MARLRLQRWLAGGYCLSAAEQGGRRSILIEGDGRSTAHVVHVEPDRWREIVRTPLEVDGGVGTSVIVLSSSNPAELTRQWLREFPNGTRRLDVALLRGGRSVRRSSTWRFADGSGATAERRQDGQTIEFRDRRGGVSKVWNTMFFPEPGGMRAVTKVLGPDGTPLGSRHTTWTGSDTEAVVAEPKHFETTPKEPVVKVPDRTPPQHHTRVTSGGGVLTLVVWWKSGHDEGRRTSRDDMASDASVTTYYRKHWTDKGLVEKHQTYDSDGTDVSHTKVSGYDGSTVTTRVVSDKDGKTRTVTVVGPDGETSSTTVNTNPDGTTRTATAVGPDGETSTTTVTVNPDGSYEMTITSTDAEGNTTTETTKTNADGSSTTTRTDSKGASGSQGGTPAQNRGNTGKDTGGEGGGDDDQDKDKDKDKDGEDDDDKDKEGEDDEDDKEREEGEPQDDTAGDGGDGSMPSDDGTADDTPPLLGIIMALLRGAASGNRRRQPGGGDGGWGDTDTVDDYVDIPGRLLHGHTRGGGSGAPPGGGSDPWGDSTAEETPTVPSLDVFVPGKIVPTADDSGWGDFIHPKALVALVIEHVGTRPAAAAVHALTAAEDPLNS